MRRTLRKLQKIEARSAARMGRRTKIAGKRETRLTNTRRKLYGEPEPKQPEYEKPEVPEDREPDHKE